VRLKIPERTPELVSLRRNRMPLLGQPLFRWRGIRCANRRMIHCSLIAAVVVMILVTPAYAARPYARFGERATVVGANQADTLMGMSAPDVIVSHGGRDVITADTRGDRVCADGTDNVYAGSDNPHVFGVGYDYLLAGHGMCRDLTALISHAVKVTLVSHRRSPNREVE
jgi:hypothetical protein